MPLRKKQKAKQIEEAKEELRKARKLLSDAQNRYEEAYVMSAISAKERELYLLEFGEEEDSW